MTTDDKTDLAAVVRNYLKRRLDFDMQQRVGTPHAPVFGVAEPGKSHASVDLEWIECELAGARGESAGEAWQRFSRGSSWVRTPAFPNALACRMETRGGSTAGASKP